MLIVLHSHYRSLCLTLLTILGLVCGHLVDTLLQMNLRPKAAIEAASVPPVASKPSRTAAADLDLILQNNIFDANNRSVGASMTLGRSAEINKEASLDASSRTNIKLFGTVVAGEASQALLQVDNKLKLYHLGEDVPDGGVLEVIRRNQVTIRNRDRSLTVLTLYETPPQGNGTKVSETRVNSGNSRGVKSSDSGGNIKARPQSVAAESRGADGGIRAVSENSWVISRDLVESVRENLSAQLNLAQMQPRLVDGKTDGFLIQRINPKSLLAKMGMQRGDVVIDVNNIKLDSPEKALLIFQQLREARQISLSIERNGTPRSLSYEIE